MTDFLNFRMCTKVMIGFILARFGTVDLGKKTYVVKKANCDRSLYLAPESIIGQDVLLADPDGNTFKAMFTGVANYISDELVFTFRHIEPTDITVLMK